MRNSGGGVFIPPVDVSNVVKPRQQTKEEIEVGMSHLHQHRRKTSKVVILSLPLPMLPPA
jgi:hypothetical protein